MYATITAISREISYATLPSISLGPLVIHFAPLGSILIILANLVTVLVLCFYGLDTSDVWQWENVGYRTGFIAICQLPLIFLLAGRRNIIGYLVDMSYVRLNWFHRWIARTLWLTATIHMGFWFHDWGRYDYIAYQLTHDPLTKRGFAAWCILTFIVISSASPVRKLSYEIFVLQHLISFIGFIVAIWMHAPEEVKIWVWIPIGILVLDRVPGQHIFLTCHRIAPFQSHPFTIASLPEDGRMEFFIRAQGGGTRGFAAFAEEKRSMEADIRCGPMFIEGPYGTHRPLRQFDSVVLFGGGMGATFVVPLLRDIVSAWKGEQSDQYLTRKNSLSVTRHIRFIWAVKSRAEISMFESQIQTVLSDVNECRRLNPAFKKEVEISIYITCDKVSHLVPLPHSRSSHENLQSNIELFDLMTNSRNNSVDSTSADGEAERHCQEKSRKHSTPIREQICPNTGNLNCPIPALSREQACTDSDHSAEESAQLLQSYTNTSPTILSGRPSPHAIVRKSLERAQGESAVVVCGPRGMVDDVRLSVVSLSDERAVHKGTEAQGIYLHVESFGI
ncbi:hypothetical protein N7481_007729 [Penicillium waksmanii]|uniref:uncharacterized protein n=1 Tax=Penicillium waksmanii TaxID=69791 RepID=UPI00254982DB|nr:uncharacterized protein N7481_007729 [Penicillium waksmanii]KAJ5980431.1 hypothetical protein N7481_007729 [Penicillium waksmanii]